MDGTAMFRFLPEATHSVSLLFNSIRLTGSTV